MRFCIRFELRLVAKDKVDMRENLVQLLGEELSDERRREIDRESLIQLERFLD